MKVVARGWSALLKMQRKDGSFSGGRMTESVQGLYTHAQATIAVCELYGMTKDSLYRSPAERAIAYAVEAQDVENGGWRYLPRQDSDTSVTGWFMMALQSARMAKLKVPDETLRRITFYLDSASVNGGRQYGYWHEITVGPAMSAEGLLCRQYLGWPQNDERLVEGVSALLKNPVSYSLDRSMPDVYYWYYATQAAHHMEGKIWEDWNAVMRKEMPAHQVKKGPEAGSWDPINDKWGSTYGRLYVTCLSVYNLEVYYRHLPIYSGYRGINALPAVKSEAEEDAATLDKSDAEMPADDEAASEEPADESARRRVRRAKNPSPRETNQRPTKLLRRSAWATLAHCLELARTAGRRFRPGRVECVGIRGTRPTGRWISGRRRWSRCGGSWQDRTWRGRRDLFRIEWPVNPTIWSDLLRLVAVRLPNRRPAQRRSPQIAEHVAARPNHRGVHAVLPRDPRLPPIFGNLVQVVDRIEAVGVRLGIEAGPRGLS